MERERCGAVGSRTADFMWRSILRSDWSLSVSDCDLIYSELALLTIKYFILLGHRVLSSYSGPLPAQAHYRTVPAPQREPQRNREATTAATGTTGIAKPLTKPQLWLWEL